MRDVGTFLVTGFVAVGWQLAACAADVVPGQSAPDFTLTDAQGTTHSLSDFKGKFIVLEWFNPECPFVRKHYGSDNMQDLQRRYTGRGVVWLTIDSSARGKQGHLSPEQAKAVFTDYYMASTALLLDPAGTVGRRYGAKTTPHMFIVNPEGILLYAGAIDDIPSTDPADVPKATNFVQRALAETLTGQPVTVSHTNSYGCSVKY